LCRDGARSGPRFSASQQSLSGPLRGPSRHKAAPTRANAGLKRYPRQLLPPRQRCSQDLRSPCGSGRAREADNAVDGTGFARVRGQARSHRDRVSFQHLSKAVAPQPTASDSRHARSLWKRASPLPQRSHQLSTLEQGSCPQPTASDSRHAWPLWERASPRSRQRSGWHGLRPCSRVSPLPQRSHQLSTLEQGSCPQPTASDSRHARSLWERVHPRIGRNGRPHCPGLSTRSSSAARSRVMFIRHVPPSSCAMVPPLACTWNWQLPSR